MNVDDLKSHKIGILGFGQEGQAVFSYLKKHGLTATVFDENTNLSSKFLRENIQFIIGEDYLDSISDCTLLFRSPGIWRNHPKILEAEDKAGTIITSQVKWFFENHKGKIVGVTGTKGKGTTSSLIYETLKTAGKPTYLTGNIGKLQPLEFLDDLTDNDIVVFELSSFQLQDLHQSPDIGICLMVTSDHLNHHANLGEYHTAKAAISAFQTQDCAIIFNADYEPSQKIGSLGKGQKFSVSAKLQPDQGAYISKDKILIKINGETSEIDCEKRKLKGAHNLENIAASSLACTILKIDHKTISQVANAFTGLEHRLQFVGIFNEVSYYNDSISTVPETTIAALNAFTQPVHLILGGSDKGLSYNQLSKQLAQYTNISSITLLGETGKTLRRFLQTNAPEIELHGPYTDFQLAIHEIRKRAKAGDVVLLSPASASFDMFKNYSDRGNKFVEIIKNS